MVNKYEDNIRKMYQKFPSRQLSEEKSCQMWTDLTKRLDEADYQHGKRRLPKRLLAATAILFLAAVIFVPMIFRFSGGLSSAPLEKTIHQSDFFTNDIILAKRKVKGGVLVFAQRENARNEQSSLNIRYVKKTIWGRWRVTGYGGGYGTSIIQTFYVFDATGPGLLSTFYGEIKDPYVRKIKVINEDGDSVPVTAFSVNHGKKRLWYALIDPSKGKKFQILGLGKDGHAISTKQYDIKTDSSGRMGSSLAFTSAEAVKKVIAKHPEFPVKPDHTITVEKPTGGPSGSYANVGLTTRVKKEDIKMYIVTFTKDWHLKVNGSDVKSVWKYRVKPDSVRILVNHNRDALVKTIK